MRNILENKKAQIAATITWIVATFVILFILILFLVFTIVLFLNKGRPKITIEEEEVKSLVLTRTLVNILKSSNECIPPELRKVDEDVNIAILKGDDIFTIRYRGLGEC